MPIYVYECEVCRSPLEVIEPVDSDKQIKCVCGGTMRRTVAGHAKTPGKWGV